MLARRMPGKLTNAPSTAEATARMSLNIHFGAGPLQNTTNQSSIDMYEFGHIYLGAGRLGNKYIGRLEGMSDPRERRKSRQMHSYISWQNMLHFRAQREMHSLPDLLLTCTIWKDFVQPRFCFNVCTKYT